MSVKQEVMQMLAQLPDDCTLEDIEYQLYVLRKIQLSEEASARGEVCTMEEAKLRFASWQNR